MQSGQGLSFVFDIHIGHHHAPFEGTRSIEGRSGDDVGELVRLHLGQEVSHSAGFKLKDPFCLAPLQQGKCRLVVQRQFDRIDLDTPVLLHILHGLVEDREVAQAQEVHLQQARFFNRRTFPLRDDVRLPRDRL